MGRGGVDQADGRHPQRVRVHRLRGLRSADIRHASGSVVFEVFDRPKLVFGVEVRDVEKFDLSLQLKLPQFTQSLEAAYGTYA